MRTWLMSLGFGLMLVNAQVQAGKPPLEAPRPEMRVKFFIQQGVPNATRQVNYDYESPSPSLPRSHQNNLARRAIMAREAYKAQQRMLRMETRQWNGISPDRPIYQHAPAPLTPPYIYYWHTMPIPALGSY